MPAKIGAAPADWESKKEGDDDALPSGRRCERDFPCSPCMLEESLLGSVGGRGLSGRRGRGGSAPAVAAGGGGEGEAGAAAEGGEVVLVRRDLVGIGG